MTSAASAAARKPLAESSAELFPATLGAPDAQPSAEAGENNLEHLRLLWTHRALLRSILGYGLLSSLALAFLIPARYQSTARLMPPDGPAGSSLALASAAMSNNAGQLGGLAGDFLGLKSNSDVFVGIISSRTVQDKLIQQFNLQKLYGDRLMEDARQDLAGHTALSVDRKSQIIAITVTDKSAQRAAAMAQAYVEELNRLASDLNTSAAHRERVFLEGRLAAVNLDLEEAEKEFSQFASKNTAIDIKEQGTAMVEAAASIQGQLIAAQSQYEGLRQIYTDSNVSVRTVKARIDELERQLQKLGGKGESTTAVSPASGDSLYPSIRKLPLLGVAYADLYRRTKIQEAVLEALTKEYELAKVQEAKEIPTVKVLDAAAVSDKRSFPPRSLIILLGTTLSFGVAVAWVFVQQAWRQAEPDDPRKLFAKEVFSTVSARLAFLSRNGSERHPAGGRSLRRHGRGRADDSASIADHDEGNSR